MPLFRKVQPPFSLKTLVKDSNCVLIQDPSAIWGGSDHLPRRNLLLATDALATQNVTVAAEAHTLYLQGTGSVTLSGTGSGTLQGTGANDRVSLAFTPTAGTLTLTVSGTVTLGMLCKSSVTDRSYQRITDWTTEQYAWAAQKNVPWLRRNLSSTTSSGVCTTWVSGGGAGYAVTTTANYGTSPDGAQTATRVQLTRGTSYCELRERAASQSAAAGKLVTCSIWLKSLSGTPTLRIGFDGTTYQGEVTLTSEWVRYSVTLTATTTCGFNFILWTSLPNTSSSADFLAWGSQTEYASTATPYQEVGALWAATYTSLAIAAGYPISLYSDRAGTTATVGPDDQVGVLLDQSEGLALGPELIVNGNFATGDLTGWTVANADATNTATYESGGIRLVSDGSKALGLRQTEIMSVGKTYIITLQQSYTSGAGFRLDVPTTTTSLPLSSGSCRFVLKTDTADFNLYRKTSGQASNSWFDNISVREVTGYHATAPSVAGSPTLRLDGNGRYYLDRDTTDDDLPITWPTNLTTTGVIYTATGDYTTKDSGLTLSGLTSYKYPQRPSGDYGRIVMAAESRYDAKIIKYLDQKRGRSYQLGPELVTNGSFSTDANWVKVGVGATISGGTANIVSDGTATGIYQTMLTVGKPYRVSFDVRSFSGTARILMGNGASGAGVFPLQSVGSFSVVLTCTGTDGVFMFYRVGACNVSLDNVSVMEILL